MRGSSFWRKIVKLVVYDLARVNGGSNFDYPDMEFNEFKPRFKSAKTRFKLSAGLNLETFDTILSGTNHI